MKRIIPVHRRYEWDVDRKQNLYRILVDTTYNLDTCEYIYRVLLVEHHGHASGENHWRCYHLRHDAGEYWCKRAEESGDLAALGDHLIKLTIAGQDMFTRKAEKE